MHFSLSITHSQPIDHLLIIIPGLGDNKAFIEFAVRHWEKNYKIKTIIHCMPWQGEEQALELKLERLIALIDKSFVKGYRVSLLGTSAGGSAAINAFTMRKDRVHRVINVCGRLRKGDNVFPALEQASLTSISFYDSVILCEANLKNFTSADCNKILTFRPLCDELVPSSTVSVPGGTNILLPIIEHLLSITIAMTVFSRKIVDFVLKD
jgi:hypothetical protein